MAGQLAGKVAIITGGGSGIGRACALRFAAEGARVCAADLHLEGAAETVNAIEATGGQAFAFQIDTSDEAASDEMVRRTVEAYGAVDCLVAAAGISGIAQAATPPPPAVMQYPVLHMPAAAFQRVIDVNFYGVLFSNRAVGRWLVANRRPGAIVNLASVMAKIPGRGGAYSVSKAGVHMLTKVLAQELAPAGIRVNAIGPGFIETPMTDPLRQDEAIFQRLMSQTPMGRMGRPEEIAATALFLCSDEASYYTGELLHPSGGMFVG